MVAAIYAVVSLTVGSGLDFDAGQEKALPKRQTTPAAIGETTARGGSECSGAGWAIATILA